MTMKLYVSPGACPDCGSGLSPVFADWEDANAATGMNGGIRWKCAPCASPQHISDWSTRLHKTRINRRTPLHELAATVGLSVPKLSAIEYGRDEPTNEQRIALTAWMDEQQAKEQVA